MVERGGGGYEGWSIIRRSVKVSSTILSPCDKGEKMPKTWYSFLLCWLSMSLEANPGLKVRLTQKGLDYGMSNTARS
ncbi:hypothetical protein AV530_010739 [Patagioenas fasciata monilis]|uniref:Uncharacterized protein n=1 Tax=Patagioenas fasciata monilis TaxID=372326 RepID=A0A1V4K7I1_PATFA|nr:hypothetical protein AV530_010739 [Patagioenas fasciata monilis]